MAVGSFIVLRNAGQWNGLHKISGLSAGIINTTTKSNHTTNTNFEKTVSLYHNGNVLSDEDDDIDLPIYLTKALILYVKAKIAEDAMQLEAKEYLMKEFRKMVEKHESGKIYGSRQIMSGPSSIR